MKKLISLLLFLSFVGISFAQNYSIAGKVVDSKTSAAIEMAGVRLLKGDSTFITGVSTSATGTFNFKLNNAGKYILQISFIGYHTINYLVDLSTNNPTLNVGSLKLYTNDIVLKAATVTAHAQQVEVKDDTLIYNAAAYRTPDGSTLEALIEKLPGAELEDDGSLKINGKTVSEILIDGKDFFKGDKSVAMKNLPVDLVEKIKTYDKQSDYTKQTGIDDGNETTVLDINLKDKLKSSWISNIDLGVGNMDRYAERIFISRFTDTNRISIYGNLNNVNDRGFRGGGGGFRGGGGGGLTANKNAGIDGFINNGKKEDEGGYFQIGGNLRINHSNSDNYSRSNSETFLSSTAQKSSFSNSSSQSYSRSNSFNTGIRLEWKPDSMTTLYFRPSYSHSSSKGNSGSLNATFNDNPYIENIIDPLDSMFISSNPLDVTTVLREIAINRNQRQSLTDSKNDRFDGELNFTRRLNNKGRSISLRLEGTSAKNSNHSYSISDIYYYQQKKATYNNQYNDNPSKNWNYSTRVSYSEPLWKNWYLQANYEYEHRFSDRDRNLYQLDSLQGWGIGNMHPIGMLPSGDSLNFCRNVENSQYATYVDDLHRMQIGFRYSTKEINFSAGVRVQPQRTKLDYQKSLLDTTVIRSICNFAPDVRLRMNFTKFTRLDIRYRGSSSQPTMTDLLDVTDSSDPLNISKGNPGLKPTWSNDFSGFFNTYSTEHHQSLFLNARFNQTSNSISNAVIYDETTGVRTTRPENINGDWSTSLFGGYNRSFGPDNAISMNTGTFASYSNNVGFMSVNKGNSEKNTMKTLNLSERLRLSYRWELFEIGINGNIRYNHSRSSLQSSADLDTYNFSYGGNLQYTAPWNMSIATDIGMNSRRGYNDASMNTNELLWNAQISQTFLNKAATISLQFYDLLHRQSSISRTINAQMRRDTYTNAIHHYAMLHFIYRLNIFNGSHGRMNFNRGEGRGEDRGGFGGYGGGYGGGRR